MITQIFHNLTFLELNSPSWYKKDASEKLQLPPFVSIVSSLKNLINMNGYVIFVVSFAPGIKTIGHVPKIWANNKSQFLADVVVSIGVLLVAENRSS